MTHEQKEELIENNKRRYQDMIEEQKGDRRNNLKEYQERYSQNRTERLKDKTINHSKTTNKL